MIKNFILQNILCKLLPRFKTNLSSLNLGFTYNLNCLNITINILKMLVKEQRVDGSWGLVKMIQK